MCKLDQIATKFFNEIKDLHPMEGLDVADRLCKKIHAARDARRAELEAELRSLDKMPEREEKPIRIMSDNMLGMFIGAALDNAEAPLDKDGDSIAV